MKRWLVLGALVAATTTTISSTAKAYCQQTTCEPEEQACKRDKHGCVSSGSGVVWDMAPIPYRFHAAGSARLDDKSVRAAMRRAVRRWEDVRCDDDESGTGGRTSLSFSEETDVTANPRGGRTAPANFGIYFRDDDWPGSASDLAATHIKRGDETGRIVGASIELNTADHVFSFDDDFKDVANNAKDLEAIMVHEVGHYLGLDHSDAPGSVMATHYCDGAAPCPRTPLELRELGADDIAGVCALYPPKRSALATEGTGIPSAGCQVIRASSSLSPLLVCAWVVVAITALAALAIRRARRSTSAR